MVPPPCSLATLQGTYIFAYDEVVIEDNGMHTMAAYAGQEVYEGNGKMTGVYSIRGTKNPDDSITPNSNISYTGEYTLIADCTFTLTTTEGPDTFHYDQFVGPNGDEFSWVATDPHVIASGFSRRVSP